MKPPAFEYYIARTAQEALTFLSEFGEEAKILAGGQSLVPLMNMRLARPRRIIDINPSSELDYVRVSTDRVHIGAMTRHRTLEQSREVASRCPLLSKSVPFIGHRQVRNRGTIGGSVVHADPAAEYPTVLAALDGEIVIARQSSRRVAGWQEFFVDYFTVALAEDEMVTEINLPILQSGAVCAFLEISRRHGDFAIVETAVQLELDRDRKCSKAAIALGGVGPTPIRARSAEALLQEASFSEQVIREAGKVASEGIDPFGDIHGSAQYRKQMVEVLVRQGLESLWAGRAKV